MKLAWLEVLDVLSKSESLSDAAKRVHKTQPALTMTIKKIEASLGFAVVDRSAYRFCLTQRGAAYCARAQHLLTSMQALNDFGTELAQGAEPIFRISYEQVCVNNELSHVLGQSYHRFASTEFVVDSGRRFTAFERVNNNQSDLGIGPWYDIFNAMGDLESLILGEIEVGLVASPDLFGDGPIYVKDLQRVPCISMLESGLLFDEGRMPFMNQSAMMKFDDIFALRSMLLCGAGWALMSLTLCEDDIKNGRLKVIALQDREYAFKAQIRAFRRYGRHHGPVGRHIWEQLKGLKHG